MTRASRARRLLRKSPRYVAWRLWDEARRWGQRSTLARARAGKGSLAFPHLPSATASARERTAANVREIGAWESAVRYVREDDRQLAAVRERAVPALRREVELFGSGRVFAGIPPRWLEDVHAQTSWPEGFAHTLDYLNRGRASDVKVPWELSRLRHLVALAQAVATLEGQEAALEALQADLTDWIARNPVGWTVNWVVGMEVALRAVNLICVDGILGTRATSYDARAGLVNSLYQHGWYLSRNLEIGDLNGNHFLANAVGLLWLGRYFEGVGEAKRWFDRGVEMTLQAAREQVLEDGLDHEGSLPYHFLVLEMMVLAVVAGGPAVAGAVRAVHGMIDAAEAVVAPSGEVPDLGDDDGGRAAAFCDAPSREGGRVIASACAAVARAPTTPTVRRWPHDAIWLTGAPPAGLGHPAPKPRRLHEGGLVVLGNDVDHVVIDLGPTGFRGRGGHGHLDAMSFLASLSNRRVVRDSGTGTYTGDAELRNELRDVFAHTTVVVDGQRYATLGGVDRLWAIEGDVRPRLLSIDHDPDRQVVEAQMSIPSSGGPARWLRRWDWSPGVLRWRDTVVSPPGTEILQLTQLPLGTRLEGAAVVGAGASYELDFPPEAVLAVTDERCSDAYGSVGTAPRARLTLRSDGSACSFAWNVRASP